MESAFTHDIKEEENNKKSKSSFIKKQIHNFYGFTLSQKSRKLGLMVLSIIIALVSLFFLTAPTPAINLQLPQANSMNQVDKLYVKGTVKPANAQIKVNGTVAQTDGEGLFTVFVTVPVGYSVLHIDAYYLGKHASFVEPVTRELTLQEQQQVTQKELAQQAQVKQQVLGQDTSIQNLLNESKDGDIVHVVAVTDSDKKQQGNYTRVVGDVRNETTKPVYWVTVTANFYGTDNIIVDTKQGIAVANNQVLKPNETHSFMTEASDLPSLYYKLTVDWQNSPTAATTSATFNGNTPSALSIPTPTAAEQQGGLTRTQFTPQ